MRTLTLVLTIGLLVLGVTVLARGEDEGATIADLQKKLVRLELEVSYLRARDADVTNYVLANQSRGEALEAMVAQMLDQGYTNKAIPPRSRETLVAGLKALGESLRADLPVVSEKQVALLKAIARVK